MHIWRVGDNVPKYVPHRCIVVHWFSATPQRDATVAAIEAVDATERSPSQFRGDTKELVMAATHGVR